jgi:hypothetical protein
MSELKPLPSSLNIVGVEWAVEQSQERWDSLLEIGLPDGVELDSTGHTDLNWQIISINPSNSLFRKWVTLTHEIHHVLEGFTNPNEEMEEPNEMFIEQIDEPLFVFLRDTFGVGLK